MPTVQHPRALDSVQGHPPAAVTVARSTYDVDRSGDVATVDLPSDSEVRALAGAYGLAPEDLRREEVCGADLSDGGTCERLASECPYHD